MGSGHVMGKSAFVEEHERLSFKPMILQSFLEGCTCRGTGLRVRKAFFIGHTQASERMPNPVFADPKAFRPFIWVSIRIRQNVLASMSIFVAGLFRFTFAVMSFDQRITLDTAIPKRIATLAILKPSSDRILNT